MGMFITEAGKVRSSEQQVAGYNLRTISISDATKQLQQLSDNVSSISTKREIAEQLFKIISGSFIHTENYVLKPWDNWLLWSQQQFRRPYVSTQDVELLRNRGGGFCLQSAMIFVSEAKKLGLVAKIALLNGHVASEVTVDNGAKIVVDTDLGILWDNSLVDFGSKIKATEVAKRVAQRGFDENYAKEIADIYVSQDNNSLANFPLSQKRYEHEQRALLLSKIIPPCLILFGFILLRGRRFF